jgi:hypothetical protein
VHGIQGHCKCDSIKPINIIISLIYMHFVFIYVTWIYVGDCYAPNHFHPNKIFGVLRPITICGKVEKILHQVIDFIRLSKFFTQLLGNHVCQFLDCQNKTTFPIAVAEEIKPASFWLRRTLATSSQIIHNFRNLFFSIQSFYS